MFSSERVRSQLLPCWYSPISLKKVSARIVSCCNSLFHSPTLKLSGSFFLLTMCLCIALNLKASGSGLMQGESMSYLTDCPVKKARSRFHMLTQPSLLVSKKVMNGPLPAGLFFVLVVNLMNAQLPSWLSTTVFLSIGASNNL